MGVPSFFAWLAKKYPRVLIDAVIEQGSVTRRWWTRKQVGWARADGGAHTSCNAAAVTPLRPSCQPHERP